MDVSKAVEKKVVVEHPGHSHILEFLDDPCLHTGSLLFCEMHGGTMEWVGGASKEI